jgi:hypothetical protein
VLFMQCQRYHHGLWHPILSLGLWRGGDVTRSWFGCARRPFFVKVLFGFLRQVLDGSSVIVEVHDYHKGAWAAEFRRQGAIGVLLEEVCLWARIESCGTA